MVQHKQAPEWLQLKLSGGEAATALEGPPGFRALSRAAPSLALPSSYRELSLDLIQQAINLNKRNASERRRVFGTGQLIDRRSAALMGKSSKKGGKKASPTGTASAGTSPTSHSPEPKSQVEEAPAEPEPVAHANGGALRGMGTPVSQRT